MDCQLDLFECPQMYATLLAQALNTRVPPCPLPGYDAPIEEYAHTKALLESWADSILKELNLPLWQGSYQGTYRIEFDARTSRFRVVFFPQLY